MATKSEKEIIRTINVNGETYGPGQEDELVKALQAHEKNQPDDGEFVHKDELKRLESIGAISGFADVADEDIEDSDSDIRATRRKNPHLLADPRPLQKMGQGPPTMEEVQMQPDANVVEEKLAGGKKANEATPDKVLAATEEAREEREDAAVQQESEQVPSPEAGSGTKPKAKGGRAKAKK